MQPDYLLRRCVQLAVVLWGAATLNFLLPRLAPGNPVRERLLNAMAQGGIQQAGVEEGWVVGGRWVVLPLFAQGPCLRWARMVRCHTGEGEPSARREEGESFRRATCYFFFRMYAGS